MGRERKEVGGGGKRGGGTEGEDEEKEEGEGLRESTDARDKQGRDKGEWEGKQKT